MTANAPIDLRAELDNLKRNTDLDIIAWAADLLERVEVQTIERCKQLVYSSTDGDIYFDDVEPLYGPKSDKEEGKQK